MKGVQAEMETLWPYKGFTVRGRERKLGEGKLTLTEQSLLFEANDGAMIGFDFPTLRLVRLADVHTVELAYSIQGELRSASIRVVCTFGDGTERDELPSEDDPYRMSLFRAITGGVVARFLADYSNTKVEGLTRTTDEKFDARIKNLEGNILLFPDKKQYEDEVWWDEGLEKRTSEASESESQVWDDSNADRLLSLGSNPSGTVDNAFEKLDLLQEDWVNGRLSPVQRARCVAMDYHIKIKMAEMGYTDERGGSPESWKLSAEKLARFEKTRLSVDILHIP
jgi:hypothetical protein